tara:strand:- start:80 stop:418 length:339 start_codon:yes stop_codon:yes gene_type:complete
MNDDIGTYVALAIGLGLILVLAFNRNKKIIVERNNRPVEPEPIEPNEEDSQTFTKKEIEEATESSKLEPHIMDKIIKLLNSILGHLQFYTMIIVISIIIWIFTALGVFNILY